jgi:hypothetical protein
MRLSELRFYLYISEAKVNMLYEQVAGAPGRGIRVSVAAPITGGTLGAELDPKQAPTRDQKLRAVEKDLEERGLVGTVEEPRDYFRGLMSMRWGLFDDNGTRAPDEAPLVYFGGFDSSLPLIVGLGGSTRHVIGMDGATSTNSRSYGPIIARWLMAGLEKDAPPDYPDWWDRGSETQALFGGMAAALHNLKPPTQELAFLARTLTHGTLNGHQHLTGVSKSQMILGTPIFVEQVSPAPEEMTFGLDAGWSTTPNAIASGTADSTSPAGDPRVAQIPAKLAGDSDDRS